ncbi:MAG: prolyl oligopeptidase family serine peptidase [Alphaproteobacteria bacterium]|nr:prolyl oligopeptidase family serine peptidase [Alphaproteobacteria bacterium]MBU1527074.1 prolyl oligopeptidase family serine peptidase [Alphaproteobacteria bacterium]MBU2118047.1 prolyl oligopeptidase family serine peptidase [Alphaproteobacteria bacterium]MBU2350000.1 prolyl oligopeptidase family serine peptidase [Alphaproteobacteria bacterium]MBU2382943.1 prolyl oligopeptidase family serine peptidase [Alphaproteobacteria bacterium]
MMRVLMITASAIALAACGSMDKMGCYDDCPVPPPGAFSQDPPPHLPTDLSPEGVAAADDHLALEQVDGAEAMAFVRASNDKALAVLTGDPRYETFRAEAEAILTATDRIPGPSFLGDGIGNFWQDGTNPKGVWRRTTLDSYASADTRWETLLDIDALARAEGKDWVFKGASCLAPDETRCLISLSDGGKDAVVVREFDLTTKAFVDGGFVLPEGKHRLSWLDADTLLVATDFGPGTLTESGYPYIVKALTRGQTLAQATEVYRGAQGDGGYGVSASVFRDADGAVQAVIFNRPLDTFRSERWIWKDGDAYKLALPERVSLHGIQGDLLIFTTEESWTPHTSEIPAGALLGQHIGNLTPDDPNAVIAVRTGVDELFRPTARQSIGAVTVYDDRVVVAYNDNVVGRISTFRRSGPAAWERSDVSVADNSAVGLGDSSRSSGRQFVSTQGFLTPPSLGLLDVAAGAQTPLRAAPPKFDASTHVVEQFEATSSDGTKIPYFVVMPRGLAMDGSAPTILFGYGGFQVSFPPAYKPEMGKLWLERGGVFVQANIRGGGEFGPGWHQAALNENRQLAFDDFAAVAEDLIARGITSPRRLGIYGRSNGGVLTSVSITQRPDLFNAAVIESPLIDMLRYHLLPAGASWIGEYGDPRIPAEAAWIAQYSAYQQLRPDVEYPRVYITTNTRDDRVHPGHSRKFAARLAAQGHDHLYFEDTAGGHSNDADPVANARRWARHYVYLAQQLMD